MSVRCFIAIELDRAMHKALAKQQNDLIRLFKLNDRAIKWTKPETIHLTIKFLGDVADTRIPEICKAVDEAAAQLQPFDFEVANCGSFPTHGAAKVLWAGIGDGRDKLAEAFEAVELTVTGLGFAMEDRKFSPHLTLGRIRDPKVGRCVSEMLQKADMQQHGYQSVDCLTVFQSDLTPAGPVYTALHHAKI